MTKVWWAIIAVLVAMQLIFALELMELSSVVKKIASIDEKTAIVKNEAALKQLESERIRATYYRVLAANPFTLNEEEARGIIRSGVRKSEGGEE